MARDVAIDLGTANTLVFIRGKGIVLNEPTVVAMHERTGDVVATGHQTWDVLARAGGSLIAVRPLRHGAITDFEATEQLIRSIFQRVGLGKLSHPRVLACVSSGITAVERRAVEDALHSAGARSVMLIDEPMAAAIGAGLAVDEPAGHCIIDVGGGTTEVAVVSMGSIVASRAIRVGGFDFDEAIQAHLRRKHGLTIGERTAESLKQKVGSASPMEDDPDAEVRGRELASGLPKTVAIGAKEVRDAMNPGVIRIVEAVSQTLGDTPPELAHDVIERGLVLAGGGALLRGLDARLQAETGIPVHIADDPLETVCVGAGRALAARGRLNETGFLRTEEVRIR
jgi:rod shape-determining protein MreB and related proteins